MEFDLAKLTPETDVEALQVLQDEEAEVGLYPCSYTCGYTCQVTFKPTK
ncbi:hypothetical protein [Phytomonospora endophytica]|uniref:Uncharacterized protein n=1 Tax=Phytomonospora endophytica TaxID=714109 RepID=A0A841FIB4_9ACTN|nr:hypothetical protein [Phytomonospora endophytica]MBB6033578.1 hypothetical protein [Phytomonospora endophytica]